MSAFMEPAGSREGEPEGALELTRELHEFLLDALVTRFGDGLRVEDASDPENGLVVYRFEVHGAICFGTLVALNPSVAVLSFSARLGRIERAFTHALRWLAHNRAFNTVSLAYQVCEPPDHHLHLSANRPTFSGDFAGIEFSLSDFCEELGKAIAGLKWWFPQFIDAVTMTEIEADGREDEQFRLALVSPVSALEVLEQLDGALEDSALLYCHLTRWLGHWERNLAMLESPTVQAMAQVDETLLPLLRVARLRALRALNRFEEVLLEVLPSLDAKDLPLERQAAYRAECLFELGHCEEALESVRSAEFDGEPWVHFIRSCACLTLGRPEEATHHFEAYKALIGPDFLAMAKLSSLADTASREAAAD